ncbi:hypothetical protein T439DRAFT_320520 [Meredithblackwellia eburnea MCA 4105]
MGILTPVAICTSSVLLGVLFTSLLFDSAILFGTKGPVTPEVIGFIENYYLTWWDGAMAVKMFLHVVVLVTYAATILKFARYTESSYYFSGGSLLLLVLQTSMYISVTIPYIRTIARDPLNPRSIPFDGTDLFSRLQNLMTSGNTGPLGDSARAAAKAELEMAPMTFNQRVEHISVLCAANTIGIALLFGIVLMQIGEWYAEETVVAPIEAEIRKQEATKVVTEEKKTQ